MKGMDEVLPGKAVGGLVGELVGRCVAVGRKDASFANVGVALAGSGEVREAVTVKVGNVTGLVGYGVDDGSGEGANVAGIRCKLDDGSGDGVIVSAMTSDPPVGNGVMTV